MDRLILTVAAAGLGICTYGLCQTTRGLLFDPYIAALCAIVSAATYNLLMASWKK